MRKLLTKDKIKLYVIFLLLITLGIFYWQTIMYLPLFGDATIHAGNAKDLVEKNWYSLNADYPAYYSALMATFYIFFGEIGFNLVVFISFIFLLLSTFLFVRQITQNYYTSLLSIVLVAGSPKIIFYSARMYQEILISALFMFTFYLIFRFLQYKNWSNLIILTFFTGITIATKQQGLIILYGTITLFLVFSYIRRKIKFLHLLTFLLIPIIIALPLIGVLYHTKGFLLPGGDEFTPIKKMDQLGQTIFNYNQQKDTQTQFAPDFQTKLDNIQQQYYYSINAWGESKHIWPIDVFTNFEKFNQANSLYLNFQGVNLESESLYYITFLTLIIGVIISIKNRKLYVDFLLITPIFLVLNYILFFRNADQQRYHIFLPIYLLAFIMIFFKHALSSLHLKYKSNILLVFALAIIIVSILSPRLLMNKNWAQSQIYTSSIGGIQSIKETGNWLNQNTSKNIILGQQCGNEIAYYSRKKTIGDWRVYLMNDEEKRTFLKQTDISYYVVYKSQIVADDKWQSFCWVPESFYNFLDLNYKKAFVSKKEDVIVYEI